MQILEKDIEGRVVRWAKRNKIKMKKKEIGELLDRWFFLPHGKLFIIEFKRPKGMLSPRQEREIRILRSFGYDVEVHTNSEEAIAAIKSRLAGTQLSTQKRKILIAAKRRRVIP